MVSVRIRAARVLFAGTCALLGACASAPPLPPPERIGSLEIHGVPPVPAAVRERLQRYQQSREAVLNGWLGDSLIISTRFSDTYQLHRVDTPLGARHQLTFFDEPVAGAYLPASEAIEEFVYARDVGGSENFQLFSFNPESRESRLLTDGESRYSGVVWSSGGDRIAYTTTERNGRDWDIHVRTVPESPDAGATPTGATPTSPTPTGATPALIADGSGWVVLDWAPDDRSLLVSRYHSANESYLYELSLDSERSLSLGNDGSLPLDNERSLPLDNSGSLQPLLDPELRVAIGNARYTPDGRGVYFTSDLGAEFLRLHHLDLDSGRISVLTSDIAWNVETFAVSSDGGHLAFSVNEDGLSRLYVRRLPGPVQVALPELPPGQIGRLMFRPDGRVLAFSLATASAPTDVFSIDLDSRELTRWTQSEVGGLDTERFAEPELIDYPTFDAVDGEPRRIPAFVYRPEGPGPHPVYISIHGGPEAQYRPRFSPALQYYVNDLGIAVVAPNVRGSAGYGKSYLALDDGLRREDAVRDIGALLDWIATQPDLDASRVVVSGGSYGGYMVLASLVHYSDRLAGGISHVGISNFVTFLTNTESYRRDLRRAEYGDERDPAMREFLERISPLTNVDRITRPLLLFQGANDPRVPASESEQIHAALRDGAVPVWYVLAHDEGHGFRRKRNADYATAATTLFLNRFLLREPHE